MPPPTPYLHSPPLPKTMVAYRFEPGLKEPQRRTLPVPVPGPDEVLVKVLAAGVCQSDVHLLEESDTKPFVTYPFTLGHEGSGIIARLGDEVASNPEFAQRLTIGTYVAVLLTNACDTNKCARCKSGFANVCFSRHMLGIGADGNWAEYVLARACTVVPVPGNDPKHPRLHPAAVATSTDAVLTPWHALKRVARVQPGQTVLIIGCGGLGSNAIQIAKHALGASVVIASDIREDSLVLARKVGADYAVPPAELKVLRDEKGLVIDVVVDVVGIQASMDGAVELVKTGGTVVLIGQGQGTVTISPLGMGVKQVAVMGTFGGDYQDLVECLFAIEQGKVVPEVEERALDDCVKVVKDLAAGRVRGRIALIPSY
ncbi:GroES-like protein [Trametes versicolor FP-101664 SS1]|uniref:GroES-like protein n=1 Tax=Trametes versicolor (strain FP-101664) TaxID=717944 RepID=UPI000462455D|nr:GroES-like protein [Trametes versicolor FP-101664 SS1]EIW63292.1 GroES-like protein [Trametes versicolor FP-101664 SS1]